MNKHQKEKSREIRDIMRSDVFSRTTYKEAKRKWKKGIRAFRIGDMYAWKAFDCSRLGFSQKQLKEVGQAYHKILTYCGERNLALNCEYNRSTDFYILRFYGRSVDGKTFAIEHSISCYKIRLYAGSLLDITHLMLEEVNRRLREFMFPAAVEVDRISKGLYPHIMLHDWKIASPEAVFGKIIVKE